MQLFSYFFPFFFAAMENIINFAIV